MTLLIHLAVVMIAFALLLTLIRLVRGPSDFDRLLAIETLALGLIGVLMVRSDQPNEHYYVDAALGLALFSFLGTAVLAIYLKRRGQGLRK